MIIKSGILYKASVNDVVNGVLKIPSGVIMISDDAFNEVSELCYSLQELVIPGSVVKIPDQMLKDNTFIRKVVIEEGVKKIGNSAFSGCSMLAEVSLPDSLIEIGDSAFERTHLRSLTLPKNVENIKTYAFSQNLNLQEVDLSLANKISVLKSSTFSSCHNLRHVNFGEKSSIKKIESDVFYMSGIENITFPSSLRELDASNLYFSPKQKNIKLNEGLEKLLKYSIVSGSLVKKIELPTTIKMFSVSHHGDVNQNFNVIIKRKNGKNVVKELKKGNRLAIVSNHKNVKASYSQEGVEIIAEDEITSLNAVDVMRVENSARLIKGYKADTLYVWLKEFRKVAGKNIKIYPTAEEISVIPTSRIGDYIKNRKVVNEILKGIKEQDYEVRKSLLTLALSLGVLEQGSSIKNSVITMFRENIFNNAQVLGEYAEELKNIKPKNKYEYNRKFNNLIKELLCRKDLHGDDTLVKLIYSATNEFDNLIKYHRNPTKEMLENYLTISSFKNIDNELLGIARIASTFKINEGQFNEIAKSYKESKKSTVKNFLDYIIEINSNKALRKGIKPSSNEVAKNYDLKDKRSKGFTFAWLDKDETENAFLGYICNSCAQIDRVGEKVLLASMLQKNVQNLVVKNEFGAIVGKTTAYLDYKEGIIFFNNIELNSNFENKLKQKNKLIVAQTFVRGINKMVKEYDKKAKELNISPIKKVNMVMKSNKLESEFKNNGRFKTAFEQYKDANFFGYQTDTSTQLTIYENKKLANKSVEEKQKYEMA